MRPYTDATDSREGSGGELSFGECQLDFVFVLTPGSLCGDNPRDQNACAQAQEF
jgi:hypothetical protein